MSTTRAVFFGSFALLGLVYACGDSSDREAKTLAALGNAQCDLSLFRADSNTCLQSFVTCRTTHDLATCRDGFVACLPAVPGTSIASRGDGRGDRDDHDDRGKGGKSEGSLASSALATCAAARKTCIADTTDPSGCGPTAAECVARAIRESFQSACTEAKARCDEGESTVETCDALTARCAQGEAPAKLDDGQCSAPAAPAPQPSGTTTPPADAAPGTDASTGDASTTDASDAATTTDSGAADAGTD